MADSKPKRPRRSYSEELKAGAVRLVLDEGKTVGAAARDLDLTESSLRIGSNGRARTAARGNGRALRGRLDRQCGQRSALPLKALGMAVGRARHHVQY